MTAPPPIRVRFEQDGQAAVVGAIREVEGALRGTRTAGQQAGAGAKQVASGNATLAASFKQLAAAIGLVQMARFITDSLEAADAIGKLSQATGVSTETMSVFAFAAKQADVETSTLRTGLRGLSKSLVELQNGNAATTAAFQALGLQAKDLEGLSVDQAFLKIANAQARYADGAGKATAAGVIFGDRVGGQLIPLLNDLSGNGFANASAEAERLGLVFSEQATRDADAFGDALGRLKGAAEGLAVQFGLGLAPSVTESVDLITAKTNEVTSSAHVLGSIVGGIIRTIVAVFEGAGQVIATIANIVDVNVRTILGALDALAHGNVRGAIDAVKSGFAQMRVVLEEDTKAFEHLGDFLFGDPDAAADRARATAAAAGRAAREEAGRQQVALDQQNQQREEREAARRRKAIDDYSDYERQAQERDQRSLDALHAEELHKNKEHLRALAAQDAQSAADEEAKRKADAERQEQEALAKTAAAREATSAIGQTAQEGLGNALADILNQTGDLGDIWRSTAVSVLQSINQIIAKLLVQLAIQQAVNAAGGLFGGGGGGAASSIKAIAKADGGMVTGPGTGTSDSIPAYLSNGEYVLRAAAVQAVGTDFLDALNGARRGMRSFGPARFADGGPVGAARSSVSLDGTIGLEDGLVGRHIDSKGSDDALIRFVTRRRKTLSSLLK